MPTKRGYRGRGRSSSGEGDYKMGKVIKKAAEKGINAYLKGTQALADKIESKLPESVRGSSDGRRGRGGGRRGRGGRRTGEM